MLWREQGRSNYIFMDPLNWKFSENKSFREVIASIRRLLEHPEYFKKSIIRSGYFAADFFKQDELDKKFQAFTLFSYVEVLENLNLVNDDFFIKHYKNPTCQLINQRFAGTHVRVELKLDRKYNRAGNPVRVVSDAKEELKRRFGCR